MITVSMLSIKFHLLKSSLISLISLSLQLCGYASFDYELSEYRPSKLVKMDILLNGDKVDALSFIVHKDLLTNVVNLSLISSRKSSLVNNLRCQIQAAIGHKIVARTDIKALRKNVLAKCYGGDVSRKRKLLEKQKSW